MMTPRTVIHEDVRSALVNAAGLDRDARDLGASLALPESGLTKTVGVKYATVLRAMNGKLIPTSDARKLDAWYEHAGRFLPNIGDPRPCNARPAKEK
jgi:hypothetical protein